MSNLICKLNEHVWIEEYYGIRCRVCGVFYASGNEPWAYVDIDDEDSFDDEYDYYEDDWTYDEG